MAVIRNLVVKIGADISGLNKGLKAAQNKMLSISQNLGRIGTNLSMKVTLPIIMLGKKILDTSAQFEQSMANAASVSGATGEELQRMTDLARQMGKTTVFSASQAADAMYYMASAGYKVEQMADSIQPILNLAAATQSDLAFTTDTVIASLNQFGLEAKDAERVTNVFASVIGNSQATLDKLSYSMRYVGPVANSLGYSIEETTAALGLLYNSGFKGEQAGTVLRGALSKLLKPTSAIEKALSELGLAYEDVNPSTKSLTDIIGALEKVGINTAQAVSIFGQEAGPGMMALISQGSNALIDMTKRITGTNAASDMAEKQLDTLQGSMKILKSMMEELALSVGDILIPVLRKLIEKYVMPFTERLNKVSKASKETAVKIAMIAAEIGPLFFILSKVVKIVSIGVKVLAFLTSPIGLIIAAIGILIFILVKLFKTNEEFRTAVLKIWESIKSNIVRVISVISEWWDSKGRALYQNAASIFKQIWDVISQVLTRIIQSVTEFTNYLSPIWEQVKALFLSLWDVISELWILLEPVFAALGGVIATLYGISIGIINGIIQALGPLVQAVINAVQIIVDILGVIISLLKGDFSGAFEHIKRIAQNTKDFFINIFEALLNFTKGFVEGFLGFFNSLGVDLRGIVQGIYNDVITWFNNLFEKMKSIAVKILDAITGTFNKLGDFFNDLFKQAFIWGKNLIQNIVDGINASIEWLGDSIKSVGQKIKDYLGFSSPTKEGPGSTADEWMPNLMSMLSDGIRHGLPDIEGAVNLTADKISAVKGVDTAMIQRDDSALFNGIVNALSLINTNTSKNNEPVELSIDGQVFARLILPGLTKELRRNGIRLEGV
jgi:TP901 family phage tail tape measure protein